MLKISYNKVRKRVTTSVNVVFVYYQR